MSRVEIFQVDKPRNGDYYKDGGNGHEKVINENHCCPHCPIINLTDT